MLDVTQVLDNIENRWQVQQINSRGRDLQSLQNLNLGPRTRQLRGVRIQAVDIIRESILAFRLPLQSDHQF